MAKKKVKNKIPSKKYAKYKLEGNKLTRARLCPKCGPAVFLGEHKDRFYCGKCNYLEMK
ncbi:30S ribosomal protein S27ae [archaeon]|nr:30S ribosomal protein S27ae [archaeon]